MDKLKPILAQKFWIFFGLVLILPLVGYFMTTGELAADIKSRWDSLENTFKGIPSGTDSPNEQWISGLQTLNDQKKLHNRQANEALWRLQKAKMRWPDDIAAVMNKAEYFKPVPPEQGGSDTQFKYQYDYPREIRRLWEIVDPLNDGKNLRDSNTRKKMEFAMADLYQTNTARWADLPPTFADIWACQEDIWLQTELLQAIARVNANAISQGDAFVKQLGKILLFGGTKATGDAGAAASGANSMPLPGGAGDGNPFGGSPMGTGGRSSNTVVSVDINLAEEFTLSPDPHALSGGASAAGGAGGFGTGSSGPMYATDGSAGGLSGSGSGAGGGGAGKAENKRYIDEDENQPYKRRGFYIKVVMDHTKVPDLIAELMNSPFPVEIVRVQQVQLSDSATQPGGGTSSPFMAGGSSGGQYPVAGGDSPMPVGDDGSAGGFAAPTAGGSSRSGGSGAGSAAAMSDPNLAQVAILGVWTLYRPPAPAPDAGQPAPSTAAPQPDVAAAPPAATQPVETTAEAKPATTETTGEEPQKPNDGSETPKADAVTPEKKEPENGADKPAEKSPTPQESTEKPASEPKP